MQQVLWNNMEYVTSNMEHVPRNMEYQTPTFHMEYATPTFHMEYATPNPPCTLLAAQHKKNVYSLNM